MVRCGSGRMRAARGPGSPSQPRPAASVAGRAIGAGQLIAGITSRVAHAAVPLLPARAPRSRKRTQTVKHTAPAVSRARHGTSLSDEKNRSDRRPPRRRPDGRDAPRPYASGTAEPT